VVSRAADPGDAKVERQNLHGATQRPSRRSALKLDREIQLRQGCREPVEARPRYQQENPRMSLRLRGFFFASTDTELRREIGC
jgi:hypothetical protein